MIRRHRRNFTLIALVVVVVMGVISVVERKVVDEDVKPAAVRHLDMFINNFTMKSMSADGHKAFQLSATRLERYSDSGMSFITQPVIHFEGSDGRWVANADHGTIDSNNIWVTLEDAVELRQLDGEDPVTIRTSLVKINTQTEVATTDRRVEMNRRDIRMSASGMVYRHDRKNVKLLQNVKGIYAP